MNSTLATVRLSFVTLALVCQLTRAAERDSATERVLDQQFTTALVNESALVLVGVPMAYTMQDRYGMALQENIPFIVSVTKVLHGDAALQGQELRIRVTRDNTTFRFDKQRRYIFFLKRKALERSKNGKPADPGWRVVSDYFGVQPYSKTLEQWVQAAKPAATP